MFDDKWEDLHVYQGSELADKTSGTLVWENDRSAPYEVEVDVLIRNADGTYTHWWATGCSCWEGEWCKEATYPSIAAAQDPVNGLAEDRRNAAFADLKEA